MLGPGATRCANETPSCLPLAQTSLARRCFIGAACRCRCLSLSRALIRSLDLNRPAGCVIHPCCLRRPPGCCCHLGGDLLRDYASLLSFPSSAQLTGPISSSLTPSYRCVINFGPRCDGVPFGPMGQRTPYMNRPNTQRSNPGSLPTPSQQATHTNNNTARHSSCSKATALLLASPYTQRQQQQPWLAHT